MPQCHLCDHVEAKVTINAAASSQRVKCPSCGEYTISHWVLRAVPNNPGWHQAKTLIARPHAATLMQKRL
jgi:ribosomal protein L32